MMNRYFVKISFTGSEYHGWQTQNNALSVQSVLNDALSVILKEEIATTGAGRTDAGVHAREFFAHFNTSANLEGQGMNILINHLNGYLPQDIAVHSVFRVKPDAHARFSAVSRTYQYFITNKKDPFQTGFAYKYTGDLDVARMNAGAILIRNTSDFTSFAKLPAETKTNICKVSHACWTRQEDLLVFTISADRFLRNMVRAIVGTLIDIGRNRIQLSDIEKIILLKDRGAAGYSVPACGLYLTSIVYPEDIILIP